MESLLIGAALGFFAGIVPGPFLALVATTSLRRGLRDGLRVALVPLLTEIPVLLLSVFVLTSLARGVLRWVGVGAGLLVLFMAWRLEVDARDADPEGTEEELEGLRGHYFRVAAVGLMAPSPWIFWFFFAGPLLLNRWHASPAHAVAFLVAFFGCFVGAMMLVAWAVATGRERLSHEWYRRALRVGGVLLFVVGSVLVWQSWVGNFQEMVRPQEAIEQTIRNGG